MYILLLIDSWAFAVIAAGVGLAILGGQLLFKMSALFKKMDSANTVPVMATIIENRRNKDGAYAAVYRFNYNNLEYTTIGEYISLTPYNVGVEVEIMINPVNPTRNSVASNKLKGTSTTVILVLFGAAALLIIWGISLLN